MKTSINNADDYVQQHPKWKLQLETAQQVLKESVLEETIKWGAPCYTYKGKNLIGLAGFKNHCAIWFHKGSLLKDSAGAFENAQPGKTKLLRQLRFRESENINIPLLRAYIEEAIAIEELDIPLKKTKVRKIPVPPELKAVLKTDAALNKSFRNLSPSCQRQYNEYITEAKRDATKQRRITKITEMILQGNGLHDTYKNS
jgi:uncharacterized protein YdeI (YjbR/CyaY-like superfamily)